jgi:succinyl-CoA synthetase beta subunit
MDIKGHTVHQVMVAQGAQIAEEYYFSILLDRANRTYLAMCSTEGGVEIEQLAVERPEALAKVPVDPSTGVDDAKAREIVDAAGFDPDTAAPTIVPALKAVGGLPRGGRDPRRGQPARQDRGRRDHRPRRQGHAGRQRGLPHAGPRRSRGQGREPTRSRPRAKEKDLNYVKLDGNVGIIGNGAGLVMSTLDVVAYAGEQVGSKPGELPRHRRRRERRGDGQRPPHHPQRPAGQVGLRQRLRRHHLLRRGRQRYRRRAPEARRRGDRPLVVRLDGNNVEEGRRILAEFDHPL